MAITSSRKLLGERQDGSPATTRCRMYRSIWCKLKPETNLALMMCLVFYLYICLGGALFLLLEGQADILEQTRKDIKALTKRHNISHAQLLQMVPVCHELDGHRTKLRMHDNLWNFLESTDYAYQIVTGQGTGQTTRVLKTQGSKIAYVFFVLFGVPLALFTFRATGQRLNIFIYAIIRFFNVKLFRRQLTPHVHLKALIFNVFLFLVVLFSSSAIYAFTQEWSLVEGLYFSVNVIFTVGNFESQIINKALPTNSEQDKSLRVLLNLFTFVAFTVMSSLTWSAHHFTRHMRFQAQNRHLARNGDLRGQCPWVEVTRSHTASPNGRPANREREPDRI